MDMKFFYFICFIILVSLQYSLFFSQNSVISYYYLKNKLEKDKTDWIKIVKKNKSLKSEINNIENNKDSLEIYAREKLGLIKENETFYQIIKNDSESN